MDERIYVIANNGGETMEGELATIHNDGVDECELVYHVIRPSEVQLLMPTLYNLQTFDTAFAALHKARRIDFVQPQALESLRLRSAWADKGGGTSMGVRIGEYHSMFCTHGAAIAYAAQLDRHIRLVQMYGERLDVNDEQLSIHDESKYSLAEFGPYAMYFFGGERTTRITSAFVSAWHHHLRHNDHHPEYWVLPGRIQPSLAGLHNGVLAMDDEAAAEMVADWLASSVQHTGSDDISQWLRDNAKQIRLHPHTAEVVCDILEGMEYDRIEFAT